MAEHGVENRFMDRFLAWHSGRDAAVSGDVSGVILAGLTLKLVQTATDVKRVRSRSRRSQGPRHCGGGARGVDMIGSKRLAVGADERRRRYGRQCI